MAEALQRAADEQRRAKSDSYSIVGVFLTARRRHRVSMQGHVYTAAQRRDGNRCSAEYVCHDDRVYPAPVPLGSG